MMKNGETAAFCCEACGEPVYEGEFYYALSGARCCVECVRAALRTAEREDWHI